MNLVIYLLYTRYFIPADKIRTLIAGYQDRTDEAFSRMFERDKNELRDMGVPLVTGRISTLNPTEGYRINRDAYNLPEITLSTDETAAVAVAMQLWQSPELTNVAQGALLKLRAAGVDVDTTDDIVSFASPAALPGIRGSEQALGALLNAIDSGQAVQFPHRPSSAEPYVTRTVEPWGVVTDRGRWYLAGWDRDRDAVRVFRSSRIGAEVVTIGPANSVRKPDDADVREIVADAIKETPTGVTARVWLADGRAVALRRVGKVVEQAEFAGRTGEVVELELWSTDRLTREIAGYGADAIVLEPESLRADVLARLRGQAGEQH
ncbi:MAG TPA: YafY family protein [Mycobacterium sp.]|nr:YafY family protein [Mycobacterium sp.]